MRIQGYRGTRFGRPTRSISGHSFIRVGPNYTGRRFYEQPGRPLDRRYNQPIRPASYSNRSFSPRNRRKISPELYQRRYDDSFNNNSNNVSHFRSSPSLRNHSNEKLITSSQRRPIIKTPSPPKDKKSSDNKRLHYSTISDDLLNKPQMSQEKSRPSRPFYRSTNRPWVSRRPMASSNLLAKSQSLRQKLLQRMRSGHRNSKNGSCKSRSRDKKSISPEKGQLSRDSRNRSKSRSKSLKSYRRSRSLRSDLKNNAKDFKNKENLESRLGIYTDKNREINTHSSNDLKLKSPSNSSHIPPKLSPLSLNKTPFSGSLSRSLSPNVLSTAKKTHWHVEDKSSSSFSSEHYSNQESLNGKKKVDKNFSRNTMSLSPLRDNILSNKHNYEADKKKKKVKCDLKDGDKELTPIGSKVTNIKSKLSKRRSQSLDKLKYKNHFSRTPSPPILKNIRHSRTDDKNRSALQYNNDQLNKGLNYHKNRFKKGTERYSNPKDTNMQIFDYKNPKYYPPRMQPLSVYGKSSHRDNLGKNLKFDKALEIQEYTKGSTYKFMDCGDALLNASQFRVDTRYNETCYKKDFRFENKKYQDKNNEEKHNISRLINTSNVNDSYFRPEKNIYSSEHNLSHRHSKSDNLRNPSPPIIDRMYDNTEQRQYSPYFNESKYNQTKYSMQQRRAIFHGGEGKTDRYNTEAKSPDNCTYDSKNDSCKREGKYSRERIVVKKNSFKTEMKDESLKIIKSLSSSSSEYENQKMYKDINKKSTALNSKYNYKINEKTNLNQEISPHLAHRVKKQGSIENESCSHLKNSSSFEGKNSSMRQVKDKNGNNLDCNKTEFNDLKQSKNIVNESKSESFREQISADKLTTDNLIQEDSTKSLKPVKLISDKVDSWIPKKIEKSTVNYNDRSRSSSSSGSLNDKPIIDNVALLLPTPQESTKKKFDDKIEYDSKFVFIIRRPEEGAVPLYLRPEFQKRKENDNCCCDCHSKNENSKKNPCLDTKRIGTLSIAKSDNNSFDNPFATALSKSMELSEESESDNDEIKFQESVAKYADAVLKSTSTKFSEYETVKYGDSKFEVSIDSEKVSKYEPVLNKFESDLVSKLNTVSDEAGLSKYMEKKNKKENFDLRQKISLKRQQRSVADTAHYSDDDYVEDYGSGVKAPAQVSSNMAAQRSVTSTSIITADDKKLSGPNFDVKRQKLMNISSAVTSTNQQKRQAYATTNIPNLRRIVKSTRNFCTNVEPRRIVLKKNN